MATTVHTRTEKRPTGREFQPLAQNAYRVLGLAGGASQAEIYEAASALRLALKLGVEKTFPGDSQLFGPVCRTETDVRGALSRLANPPQRIFERLFWFHEAASTFVVNKLGELPAAVEKLTAEGTRAARHDAALLSVAALLRLDAELKDEAAWVRSLSLWKEVVEGDEFWTLLVAADLKGDFEPLATYGEVRELRGRALRVLTTPVADRAKDALAREDFRECRRALAVLRGAALPEKLWAEYENEILSPVEDKIEETCESVFSWARWASQHQSSLTDRVATYSKAFSDYEQRLRPLLKKIFDIAGAESHAARRAFELAASNLYDLATYYEEIGDSNLSFIIARAAWKLAPPESATLRLIEEKVRPGDPAQRIVDKSDAGYAAVLAAELRPTISAQPDLFTQFTAAPQPKSNKGCTSLLWIGFGLLMCVMLGKCGSPGLRQGRKYTPPPPTNFNYNIAIPQPFPRLNPMLYPELRPVQPPQVVRKRKRAGQRR
ncbi:MAG: hypothetical protein LC754_06290 [Acidobacteria bacterium]|nr:hypothetical protein [Acidobacteriota bacterium]